MHAGRLGTVLVAAQFALIALLAAGAAPDVVAGRAPPAAVLLAALAAAVGAAALAANRPGNFNIRPLPRAGGRLVTHGVYRWVRHPMYTAVMLFGAAAAWAGPGLPGAAALVALVGVLVVKAGVEERAMAAAHPGYAAYCARTRRFVPYLV
mgnify:CR=1 FL=1